MHDPKRPNFSAEEICGEEMWRYIETIPGLFIEGGCLCSEMGLQLGDIHLRNNNREHVIHHILGQLAKLRAIKLEMYERVIHID